MCGEICCFRGEHGQGGDKESKIIMELEKDGEEEDREQREK